MFANDIYTNIVAISLMILGSIGFFVIEDIINCIKKKNFLHLSFHTKIVLLTTLVIYIISIIFIKISQPNLTILQVLFMSVTLRTAGFATINMEATNEMTRLIFIMLMMIGGAPGSTSGGIRITSIAVIFLTVRSIIKNRTEVIAFYKKIDTQTIKQAITNIIISLTIVMIAIFIFWKVQDIGLMEIIFSCVSAFSTTGLTIINIGDLRIISKFILMLLMFFGRVGAISILSIFVFSKKENKNIDYVAGNLML